MHKWGDRGRYEGRDEDSLKRRLEYRGCIHVWRPMTWGMSEARAVATSNRVAMAVWDDNGAGLSKSSYGYSSREA